MGLEKTLTKEWSRFDGDYEKSMQDIKLHDGRVIFKCWPNAGAFSCFSNNDQPDILYADIAFVRLTHDKNW